MAGSNDPIVLLQTYVFSNKPIQCRKGSLYFDLIAVPLSHPTAWRASSSIKHYTLGALWLFLHHRKMGFSLSAYIKDCQSRAVGFISAPDQEPIISFFEGSSQESECIDEALRPQTLIVVERFPEQSQCIRPNERPFCTKEMILSCHTSFRFLLQACRPYLQEIKTKPQVHRTTVLESIQKGSEFEDLNLIIIVPGSGAPGNLAISNCKLFLELGGYEIPGTNFVPQPVLVSKQLKDRYLTFEVYDHVFGFTPKHWSRVVAVFIHGPKYQFKDWTGFQTVSKIFEQVCGFYLKYQDSNVEDEVLRWAIKILDIGRSRRHLDKVAHTEFWRQLEAFLWSYKEK